MKNEGFSVSRIKKTLLTWLGAEEPRTRTPQLDVTVLEDRILYSATPMPLDAAEPPPNVEAQLDDIQQIVFVELADSADEHAQEQSQQTQPSQLTYEISVGDVNAGTSSAFHDTNQAPEIEFEQVEPSIVAEYNDDFQNEQIASNLLSDGGDSQLTRSEIAFIDSAVAGYEFIVANLEANVEVIILDSEQDGLLQITQALAGRSGIDALHIFSHGVDGGIQVGATWINDFSLQWQADIIASWSTALSAEADLLLYGCNIASTADGQNFLQELAALTGADVAASDDLTGHASLNGDWELEYRHGDVSSELIISAYSQINWYHTLNLVAAGGEALVHTSTPENQFTSGNGGSAIDMDASGRYVVAWEDDRSGNADTYAAVYNADGTVLTSEFRVHAVNSSAQTSANVAMADNGNFVVTWTDNRSGTNEVYMRLFDINGTAITGETVVSTLADAQTNHSADFGADNSFVIVFQDTSDVYFQRYNSSGVAQGANTIANNVTTGVQNRPDVAIRSDGIFIVTWTDANDGNGTGIYARAFSSTGVAVNNQSLINSTITGNQDYSSIGIDDSNNVVISFTSSDGNQDGVFARRFNASGVAQGNDFQVNTYTQGIQTASKVAVDGDGDFVVTWHDTSGQDGAGTGVYAQQFNSSGTAVGGEIQVAQTTSNNQRNPSVALNGSLAVIVWSGNGSQSGQVDASGVFARQFALTGVGPQTYTVTSTLDNNSIGSLRWAVTQANANTGTDTIEFAIAGTGVHTINVLSSLTITDAVTIDATTDDSFAANSNRPAIILDGNNSFTGDGFVLTSTADGTTIRGFVIRDFTGDAIEIQANSNGNTIAGNYIGQLTETGTDAGAAETNSGYGIHVLGANNTIGGSSTADRNVISGNTNSGIYITGTSATGNLVAGNYIGTNAAGTSGIANSQDGIALDNGSNSNLIGGEINGAGNLIAFNLGNGVDVTSGVTNAIVRNSIHSNTLLGINLGTAGVTANDSGDGDTGANNLQNSPVLTSAVTNGTQITITGTLNSIASTSFRIEYYSNTTGDSTGYGEGQTLIGVTDITTDTFGNASHSSTFTVAVSVGSAISAIVSKLDLGDSPIETSEFAQNVIATSSNTAPGLTLPGAAVNYTENNPATVIDATATASDSDSANFDTGTLTIDFIANGTASDRLAINNQGSGAGQIGVSGSNVSYQGTTIGVFTGGTDGTTPLVITLNANATPTATQALIRNITYENVSDVPSTLARTVRFVLTDGDGGTSIAASKTINVTATNDQAAFTLLDGTPAFTEGGSAVVLDSNVTIFDAELSNLNNFSGATLTLVRNGGANSSDVYFGSGTLGSFSQGRSLVASGITVGSVTTNSAGTLVLTFNASATNALVNSVMQQIAYSNTSDAPPASAEITWTFNDGNTGSQGSGGALTATGSTLVSITDVPDVPQSNDDDGHVSFDGIDDVVVIADSASLNMTNTMTMEALINPVASAAATRMIINKEGEYEVGVFADNTLRWAFANTNPGWAWVNTGYVIDNNVSTHIAISYDNGNIQTYVNGNLVHSYAGSGPIGDSHPTLDELHIGGRMNNPSTQYYAGAIDDVRIWNVARSQAEIQASLDQTLVGNETGLVGYYRFNEASGTTATDLSSFGNHGVLTGGVTRVNYLTDEDTSLAVGTANGVLANDRDGDGNTLTVTALNGIGGAIGSATTITSGALVTLNSDGSFTYNANGSFNYLAGGAAATDSFTYTASDGTGNTSTSTVVVHITGANDAPVLDNTGTMTLTSITEDQTTNSGNSVASIVASAGGNRISDVDTGAVEGIAVTSLNSGNGTWQFTTNGFLWADVGAVSESSALLLRSTDLIRFIPDGDSGTTASFDFRAWDRTSGSVGSKVDVSTNGGTTAFSSTSETASLIVTDINDEQVLATNTGATFDENSTSNTISTGMLATTDVDHTASQLIYTITTYSTTGNLYRNGVLLSNGGTFTQADIDSNLITYSHNGTEVFSDSFSFSVDDGFGTASSGTFNITLNPVNDQAVTITSNGGGASASITQNETISFVTQVTVNDGDLPGDTFTYSIIGGLDQNDFMIDSSGNLSFVAGPDYESPTDGDLNNVYTVTVQVSDGVHTDSQTITVTIVDVQDSALTVTTTSDVDDTGLGASYTIEELYAVGGGTDGHVSLREAIIATNNTLGADTISFAILNTDAGYTGTTGVDAYWQISLTSALPTITESVILDGLSQTSFGGNVNPGTVGVNSSVGTGAQNVYAVDRPEIAIVGASGFAGIVVGADDVTIQGFSMYGFSSSAAVLLNNGTANALIQSNVFGTGPTAVTDPGAALNNNQHVRSLGADNGTLANNVLAYSKATGFYGTNDSNDWNVISNHFIDSGYNFSNGDAIAMNASVGGLIDGNIFTGSSTQAIILSGSTSGVTISNNTITGNGIAPITGSHSQYDAIALRSGTNNITISQNIIADNYGAGITVNNGAYAIEITQNSFYGNGTILSGQGAAASGIVGIDLQASGENANFGTAPYYTANDLGDADTGGNSLQNFPVFSSASSDGTRLNVSGSFNSIADRTYRIEFFLSEAYANGHGQGQTYLGSTNVTTDGSGNAVFSEILTAAIPTGMQVTATATDLTTLETSEFSQHFAINDAPTQSSIEGIPLAYIENQTPTAITSALTLADEDDTHIESAVVAITGNYATGQDILAFVNTANITAVWDAMTGTLTLTGTDTIASYQAALRSITYANTSDAPSTATRTVSFTVYDGQENSNTQTRDIQITAVNDSPTVATNTGATVAEGSSVVITNAMLNESDPDDSGAGITYTLRFDLEGGSLLVNGTALTRFDSFTQADIDAGLVVYQHLGGEDPTEQIRLRMADGGEDGATTVNLDFNITVTPVNDAPVAAHDPAGTAINLANDPDAVGFWRLGESSGPTANDETANNNHGTYVSVNLGETGALGDGNTAGNFDGTSSYLDLGTLDVAGSGLTLSAWINPYFTLTSGSRIISKADGIDNADHTFMLSTIDVGGNSYLRFRVSAGGHSDNLIAHAGGLTPGVWQHVAATYDAATGRMAIYLDGMLVEQGTHSVGGGLDQDPTRSVWVGANPGGTDFFDGAIDEVAILSRALDASELASLAELAPPDYSVDEDATLTVSAANGVLRNDSDVDGDPLTAVLVTGPAYAASFTLNANGSFSYTGNANFNGTDSFTYRAFDGTDYSEEVAVSITVNSVNDDPTADHGGPYTINEGDSLSLDASGSADIDGDTLTYRWDLNNDAIYDITTTTATISSTWSALASYGINDDGVYTIGLQVDDGNGGVVTTSTTVTVVNVAPTLTATGAAMVGGGETYTLTLTDVDPGNDTISQWIVNWGDGTITTYVGDPASVTHVYSNDLAGLTFDITVSAIDEDGQYFAAHLLVPAYSGDYVNQYSGIAGTLIGSFAPSSDGILGHANIVLMPNGNYLVSGVVSGNIVEYQPDGTLVGDFVTASNPNLNNPGGMAYGPDGHLFVADYGAGKIVRFDGTTGAYIDDFVASGLTSPLGLQFGPDGNLYVANRGSAGVLRYDGITGTLDTGFVVGSINGAEDLTFGPDGNIYVGSWSGVIRVDAITGATSTFIATGTGGLGLAAGVDFGPDGDLYVTDESNNVIRRYDGTTGAYIDNYATGISGPAYLEFTADHRVTISNSNQSPMIATNTGSIVLEGSLSNAITTAMLNEGDPDDDGAELTYTITSNVANGTLRLNGSAIGLNDTFTQADIDSGLVTYDHDGSETTADSFDFSLADGGENGSTPATGTFNLTVTPVNDAPVLDNSGFMSLTTISEDDTNNAGNTIAEIIASAGGDRITDPDAGALEGIAITTVSGTNGVWQFNTGSGWTDVGAVDTNNAMLLRDTDSLRFVPNAQNGDTGTVLFHAWDQSSGTAGTKVDATSTGGTTAFSSQVEVAIISVTDVNDAPVLTSGSIYSMTSIDEESTSAGVTVATILSGTGYADVDSGAQSGMAITGRTGNGTWQYSTDGTTWVGLGAVSSTNAILLTSTTQVRYIGDTLNGETANFSFVAWDRTSGTASTNATPSYADPGAGGGTTAFSPEAATNQIVVTDVNDAPVQALIEGTPLAYTENDGAAAITSTIAISDVDDTHIESAVVAISGNYVNGQDVLTFVDQNGISGSWNATTGELTLTGSATLAQYETALRSITYTNTSEEPTTATRTISFTVNDGDNNSNSLTRDITVLSVNDAPVITVEAGDSAAETLTETNTTLTSSGTLTVSDADLTDVVSSNVTAVVASGTTTGLGSNNAALLAMLTSTTNVLNNTQTTGTLTWNFNSGSEAFNYLASGESLTLTYTIQVEDSQGATATQNVVITINGTNDTPVITDGPDAVGLTVSGSGLTTNGSLTVTDVDRSDIVTATVDSVVASGSGAGNAPGSLDNATVASFLSVSPNTILDGTQTTAALTWNFNSGSENFSFLAAGETYVLTYTIRATDDDGTPLSDTETVTITITGGNNTPDVFVGAGDSAVETLAETNGTLTSSGTLSVTDSNVSDIVTSSVTSVVTSGTTIGLGSNNAALLAMLSSTANVLDNTQTSGTLTWNFNSGSEAFDYLASGEALTLTYTIEVQDSQGATDTQIVAITINGTADAPVIAGGPATSALTETDAGLTDSGTFTVTDLDLTDNVTAAVDAVVVSGTGASSIPAGLTNAMLQSFLSVTPTAILDGTQTTNILIWNFDSGSEAFDFLATGETLILTYSVSVTDDDGSPLSDVENVTITIAGTNDAPISVADTAIAIEAGGISNAMAGTTPTGNVLVNDTDVDADDTKTVVGVAAGFQPTASGAVGINVTGLFGSITIATDGTYTYTVDNGNPSVQALRNSSDSLEDVFTYTMQDSNGLTSTTQVTITIQGANDAPHDILSGPLAVDENAPVGSSVGTVTGQDVDAGEIFTYTMLDSAGGRFTIDNAGQITVANGTLLDRESAASHWIRVQVTDASGASYEKDFLVDINDVNEFDVTVPIDDDPSANIVVEDATIGTAVGITALASDADATTNTVTYTLDDDAGGLFAINSSTGVVTVAGVLDYETWTSHIIILRATSADGSHATETFTIDVTDVNENAVGPISDTDPANNFVLENTPPGTYVSITAFASDPDGTDTVTYSLDNDAAGRFGIDLNSGMVSTLQSLNFEENAQYNITVRASSSDGSFQTADFLILIGDVNESPVAANDFFATSYIDKLVITADVLKANDADPDGDALHIIILTSPTSGTLATNAGSFTYTPVAGYVGTVSFTYAVSDGQLQSPSALVTIAVTIPTNVPAPETGNNANNSGESSGPSNQTSVTSSDAAADSQVESGNGNGAASQSQTTTAAVVALPVDERDNTRTGGQTTSALAALDEVIKEIDAEFSAETNSSSSGIEDAQYSTSSIFRGSTIVRQQLLEDELMKQKLDEINQIQMILADARPSDEERAESVFFGNLNPIVTTAVGTGVVIWIIHASQVAAAVLSTASAWVQLDPLTVLQGASIDDEPTTAEELIFDAPQVERKGDGHQP